MINIQLEICGEEVEGHYIADCGSVNELYLTIDNESVQMNELLEIESVYNAISDHYDNLLLEA